MSLDHKHLHLINDHKWNKSVELISCFLFCSLLFLEKLLLSVGIYQEQSGLQGDSKEDELIKSLSSLAQAFAPFTKERMQEKKG